MKTKEQSFLMLVIIFVATLGVIALTIFGIGEKSWLGYKGIKLGLDLQGGVYITYQAATSNPSSADMDSAVALIQDRLDRKGWTEAECSKQGTDRIKVEIPGVENADEAVEEIGQTAQLRFLDPNGDEILTGTDVKDAKKQVGALSQGGVSEPYVALEFTSAGSKAFADATTKFVGQQIHIMLDTTTISSATVNEPITDGSATISGGFTAESAQELADLIRAGSLPFDLTVIEMQQIGARLGSSAIELSLIAGIVALVLIIAFIVAIYRMCGVAASWALILHTGLVFTALSLFGVTLTLPGIAGMILSIGMSVDANVIIFERFNEEMKSGKTLMASVAAAFKRAFPPIIDSNIAAIIAGVVLFNLGTGPIKGFAQTLIIGIILSLFTSLTITRLIIKCLVSVEVKHPKLFIRNKFLSTKEVK